MNLFRLKINIPLYISFLLTVIFIIVVYFQLDEGRMNMFINSDTLYLPSFFRDLFYDKAKNFEWHVPGATCFFPDLILFFTVHLFTLNFIKAMFFSGILMNILLILSFYLLLKESIKDITPLVISTGINLLLLFHIASLYTGEYAFTFYLTITNYHLGAYIASLFCLYFTIRYLKTNKFSNLIIMLLIYTLTSSSDFLTLFNLVIPLLSLFILFFKKQFRTQACFILISNILGFVIGYNLYHLIATSKAIKIVSISTDILNFDRIGQSYSLMFKHHLAYLKAMDVRTVIVLLSVLSFVISSVILVNKLVKFFRSDKFEKSELLEMTYLLFIVTQTIAIYNGPGVNGVYMDVSIFRYNVYVFFLMILNSGYLFFKLSRMQNLSKPVYISSVVIIIFFSFIGLRELSRTHLKKGAKRLFDYYPEYVKNIDELCMQHNLRFGLASYWVARRATMLSKHNIRIYQTYYTLQPYPHVVNQNWYYGTEDGKVAPPVFQFVIPDDLTDSIIYPKLKNHILDTLNRGTATMILTDPFTIGRTSQIPEFN